MGQLNPDELDLENEPWYKFFSELEFGRPVSGWQASRLASWLCVCFFTCAYQACGFAEETGSTYLDGCCVVLGMHTAGYCTLNR